LLVAKVLLPVLPIALCLGERVGDQRLSINTSPGRIVVS
jgi:hypothetical protein